MKKAFSTLGCPTWTFSEVIAVAKDIGMDGIEIRGIGSQMYAPSLPIFRPERIASTIATLKRTGLEIPMLTSACDLSADDFNLCLQEASDYIDIAQKLGVPYVRIMVESSPKPIKNININEVAKRYAQICDLAKDKEVFPVIETNSVLADSDLMLEFLQKTDRKNAKVLWDIHHPYRFFGESIDKTFSNLKEYIVYVHIKDSIFNNGKLEYKMLGYGDIPIEQAIALLKSNGYDGYISLEWVKRWIPQLEESGIVFPQYSNFIDDLG